MLWIRQKFDRVHRHGQHRIITDAGRQLHILVGSQPLHDRLRQRCIDAVLAQPLPSEINDLKVIRRKPMGMIVTDRLNR